MPSFWMSRPPANIFPSVGASNPSMSFTSVVLPPPGSTDDRDRFAGRDAERAVEEHEGLHVRIPERELAHFERGVRSPARRHPGASCSGGVSTMSARRSPCRFSIRRSIILSMSPATRAENWSLYDMKAKSMPMEKALSRTRSAPATRSRCARLRRRGRWPSGIQAPASA